MSKTLTIFLICAAAQAATTVSTNLAVNASVTIGSTGVTATGTATFTGGLAASGSFSGSVPITGLSGSTANAAFTITLSNGTLTGTLVVPTAVLEGATTSATGSATITGGTGNYSGATGSFPSLAGTGGLGTSGLTIAFTGPGTITTGGSSGPPPPTITQVWDAGSNQPVLAQSTIFIIKGTYLCPSSGLIQFNVPRPITAPDGLQITFTPAAGGSATSALIWYEDNLGNGNCQLAGILPSSVAPGTYNVTVTAGTVSAPVSTQVVASKFEIFTQDSTGMGTAVAQQIISQTEYDLNRLTTGNVNGYPISPAHGGQVMVVYGTGMGPVAGSDNASSPVYDFTKNGYTVQAVVGGTSIPVLFAGLAGFAGEDQINFQLPSNIATGCAVPFQISVNGQLSATTTLSIAPAGATACVQPGLTNSQLAALDSGGTITTGGFSLEQFAETISGVGSIKADSASGGFTQITGAEIGAASTAQSAITQLQSGSCNVFQLTSTNNSTPTSPGAQATNLDAGVVTLSGPSGSGLSSTMLPETLNAYYLQIGEEGITIPGGVNGKLVAGTYTLNGAGGKDIGKFSTSINLSTPLNTTLPSSVNRSQPLTLTWTGGSPTDVVAIFGYSAITTGPATNSVTTSSEFVCITTAGAGSFTVGTSILSQLQAVPANSTTATGILELVSGPTAATFTAPLTAGGNVSAAFNALIGYAGTVSYQ